MARSKQKRLILAALRDAIEWQDSIADAYAHCDGPEAAKARDRAKEYAELHSQISGVPFKRFWDILMQNAVAVPVTEILERMHQNEEKADKG